MPSHKHAPKPVTDTSVLSAGNLFQTRPFQPDATNAKQAVQRKKETAALTGGFDLTKIQYDFSPPPISSLDQPLQAKLTIRKPNNQYEQEADRVAHDVVQRSSDRAGVNNSPNSDSKEDVSLRDLIRDLNRPVRSQLNQPPMPPITGGFDLTKKVLESGPPLNPSYGLPLQAKLTIGAPNDKYEQEADRVAKQVVQRLSFSGGKPSAKDPGQPPQPNQTLQRETLREEEDELQMKPLAERIQRVELPEEDELQMKPLLQRQGSRAVAASNDLESAIQQSRGNGQPLSDDLRQPMEHAFGGVDFSGVNVHTDGRSDQLNRSIQAKAFTTGQDIFFRQGAYQPGSQGGQELLAHELTHVVQQKHELERRGSIRLQRQINEEQNKSKIKQKVSDQLANVKSSIELGISTITNVESNTDEITALLCEKYDDKDVENLLNMLPILDEKAWASAAVLLSKIVEFISPSKSAQSKTKEEAIQENKADADKIKGIVLAGKDSKDGVLRNTCDWIVAGKTLVYTLTKAEDISESSPFAKFTCMFPDYRKEDTHILSSPYKNNYEEKENGDIENANPDIVEVGTKAGAFEGKILFYQTNSMSDQDIAATLKHEVQHIADKSAARIEEIDNLKNLDQKTKILERCLERYKTEYRAYWIEGTADTYSNESIIEKYGYKWTEKQLKIFEQIYGGYSHTKLLWDFSAVNDWNDWENTVSYQAIPNQRATYAVLTTANQEVLEKNEQYRQAVVAYVNPEEEGANKFNSIKLDNYYLILTNQHLQDQKPQDWAAKISSAWQELNREEKAFVNQSKTYKEIKEKVYTLAFIYRLKAQEKQELGDETMFELYSVIARAYQVLEKGEKAISQ